MDFLLCSLETWALSRPGALCAAVSGNSTHFPEDGHTQGYPRTGLQGQEQQGAQEELSSLNGLKHLWASLCAQSLPALSPWA